MAIGDGTQYYSGRQNVTSVTMLRWTCCLCTAGQIVHALAGFKGPTSRGRGGQRGKGEGEGEGRRKGHTGTSFPHVEPCVCVKLFIIN